MSITYLLQITSKLIKYKELNECKNISNKKSKSVKTNFKNSLNYIQINFIFITLMMLLHIKEALNSILHSKISNNKGNIGNDKNNLENTVNNNLNYLSEENYDKYDNDLFLKNFDTNSNYDINKNKKDKKNEKTNENDLDSAKNLKNRLLNNNQVSGNHLSFNYIADSEDETTSVNANQLNLKQ